MADSVTLSSAQAVVEAARAKADEIGVPMNIAVVDDGNNLTAFARMDGAWLGSIDIAQNKAYTARSFDMSTKDLAPLCQPNQPLFGIQASNQGRLIVFAGGIPLQSRRRGRRRDRRQRRQRRAGPRGRRGRRRGLLAGEGSWPTTEASPTSSRARSRSTTSTSRASSSRTGRASTRPTWAKDAPRGDPADRLDEHLRLRPAHGPRPHDGAGGAHPRPRDHRRGDRDRARRRVHQGGRPRARSRSTSPAGGAGTARRATPASASNVNPDRAGLRLRLRGHGGLGRGPGRVRDGAVRGLEPAQVPRQGAGAGEDPRPDDAVGHLPDRLSRRRTRRASARARRCTSRGRGRWASPPLIRRSCSGRPW